MQLTTDVTLLWGSKNLATIPVKIYIKALTLIGNVLLHIFERTLATFLFFL